MDIAMISDLKVNVDKKLNNETKKHLVNIIDDEFGRQQTLYNAKCEQEKEEILDKYRKSVGYAKLKTAVEKAELDKKMAEQKLNQAKLNLYLKGLDESGKRLDYVYGTVPSDKEKEVRDAMKKVSNLLLTVRESEPQKVKSKIMARMWMSDTMGEAMVILREVLGNGIIPTVSKKQLVQIEHK